MAVLTRDGGGIAVCLFSLSTCSACMLMVRQLRLPREAPADLSSRYSDNNTLRFSLAFCDSLGSMNSMNNVQGT
jgi:hypothetical protein